MKRLPVKLCYTHLLLILTGMVFLHTTMSAQAGYTLDFDGSSSYVEIPHDASFNIGSGDFTVEGWIKASGSGTTRTILDKDNMFGGSLRIGLTFGDKLECVTAISGDGDHTVTSAASIGAEWTHFAVLRSGSTLYVYINGLLDNSNAGGLYDFDNSESLFLGADYAFGGQYNIFSGKMDDIRIWSDARSQAEIQGNMYRTLTGSEANLVSWYQMSNGSGTTLTDNSDNANNGTLYNSPAWKASGAFAGPRMALDFDGVDDFVYAPLNCTASGTITLEGWFSFNSLSGQQNLMNVHQTANSDIRIVPYKTAANLIAFYVFDGSASYVTTSSYSITQTNTWHHLVFIYNSGTVYIYANGFLVGSATGQGSFSTGTTNLFSMGADYNGVGAGFYSNVKIDEVRIWSDVRSEAEIRTYKDQTLEGSEAGLLSYYRLDQQPDAGNSTTYDYSSSGHNGTLAYMTPASDWVSSAPFNTWIGSEDGDVTNTENWSRGAVPSTEDVAILAATGSNPPVLGNIYARNFFIDQASVYISVGNLILSGNFINLGTAILQGITFEGSAAQRIAGTGSHTFSSFAIDNSAGITQEANVTCTGTLYLTSGTLDFDGTTLYLEGVVNQTSGSLSGGTSANLLVENPSGTATSIPPVSLNNLSVNRNSGITMSGDVSVNGSLILVTGTLDLNSHTLSLGSSATVSGSPGSSTYILATSGTFRKDYSGAGSFLFPVGNAMAYSPITLNFTSGDFSGGYATVNLTASKHPNNISTTSYINRYWTVSSGGISTFSCDVSAVYDVADVAGSESSLHGAKYSDGSWTDLGAVTPASHLLTGTVTSFSDFTAGEEDAFPVEWLSFSAKPYQDKVLLEWVTATELNSDFFAIERSADQQSWNTLAQVSAAGYSHTAQNYSYEDIQPVSGITWYRLRQVDLDGSFDYSHVVEVHPLASISSIYPNPVNDQLTIDLPGQTPVTALLFDMQGRIVMEQKITSADHSLPVRNLPAGIYTLRLSDGQGWTQEMQVVKE
ncbi:MAG: LamG-like jellyroll fold domain-containing protein [Bacteroidia bacterium]